MYEIRKISVGPDYKNAMHFQVGQRVLGASNIIERITLDDKCYRVWIINEKQEIVLWKNFDGMPVSVEYLIDF